MSLDRPALTNQDAVHYLHHRHHALVVVRVGLDLEALAHVAVDDGVDGPPGAGRWVVPVVHRQVHDDTRRALVHGRLELRHQTGAGDDFIQKRLK